MKKNHFFKTFSGLLIGLSAFTITACGSGSDGEQEDSGTTNQETEVSSEVEALADPMQTKGVGPVSDLQLDPTIDQELATEGQAVYEQYCTACHKIDERYIGPSLKEVTTRRSPEWIMNMILNPDGMVKEDPIAKQLLQEYLSPMANQNLTEQEARSILEYFRTLSEVDSLNHQQS